MNPSSTLPSRSFPTDLDLTTAQVAAQVGFTTKTVANWRTLTPPRGPSYFRVAGGRIRYRQSDVDDFLASC